MKNYIKYIIILVVIFGIILGANYLFKPSMDSQISDYLLEHGFIKDPEYENLFVKEENENKTNSFSLGDYTFMLNVDEERDGMQTSLNATYDYKEENIIYSYRVNYDNNVNVYFKGNYKDQNFVCEKEFSSHTLSESEKENICNLAEVNIKIFELEAKTLFTKYKFVDYIKNK